MFIPITPIPKPRMTQSDRWRQRPAVMRYRAFGDELRQLLSSYTLPDEVQVTFFMPMPKSWSLKKQAAMEGQPHQVRPDIDNLCKALFDHLAKEDKYIWHVDAKKVWSKNGGIMLQ